MFGGYPLYMLDFLGCRQPVLSIKVALSLQSRSIVDYLFGCLLRIFVVLDRKIIDGLISLLEPPVCSSVNGLISLLFLCLPGEFILPRYSSAQIVPIGVSIKRYRTYERP